MSEVADNVVDVGPDLLEYLFIRICFTPIPQFFAALKEVPNEIEVGLNLAKRDFVYLPFPKLVALILALQLKRLDFCLQGKDKGLEHLFDECLAHLVVRTHLHNGRNSAKDILVLSLVGPCARLGLGDYYK